MGGFWTRTNSTEIDIIGADRSPIATRVAYPGTIKWHQTTPIDQIDINRLVADVVNVTGACRKRATVSGSGMNLSWFVTSRQQNLT